MFDGWVPREIHEHYELPDGPDGEPKLVGYTVTTRETEWDDVSQQRALALHEYETGMCTCGCNRPAAESHQKQAYYVHEVTCYAGRAIDVRRRKVREEHKDAAEGWDDGIHYFVEPAKSTDPPIKPDPMNRMVKRR